MPQQKGQFNIFLSRAILVALVFALIAFIYSLFLTKYWQVTGKIVIVPSGSSATASQNLYLEAGNATEMINSPSFRKNILGDDAKNYDHSELVKNSSTVSVFYLAGEADIEAAEDAIVRMPDKIAAHARDLYSGSPFKYILVSDPEISQNPAKPDIIRNVEWGFAIGLALYCLFWILYEVFKATPDFTENTEAEERIFFPKKIISPVVSPVAAPKIEIPAVPEKEEAESVITPRDMQNVAPSNLPIAGDIKEETNAPVGEISEPSDEEVKDRLNKLMRGEL